MQPETIEWRTPAEREPPTGDDILFIVAPGEVMVGAYDGDEFVREDGYTFEPGCVALWTEMPKGPKGF